MTFVLNKILSANYADYYDQKAEFQEWRRLGAVDKSANIIQLCSELQHDNVLEIGCGNGAILERLASLGFGRWFTGLEISASAVSSAQARAIPGVKVQLFDGYELPFSAKCFDLAILSHVIEHVEYPRKLIYEAARVATHIFVEVPLEDNWRLSNDFTFDRVGHINFYSAKTIRSLVQSCGMKIVNGHLSHSSPNCYVYRKGRWRGNLGYWVKELALKVSPKMAAQCLTYHYSLVYTEKLSEP